MWSSKEIRETYLSFFEKKKQHLRLPSFSLVPKDDPTLLLIGAGMAPFKPEFAGKVKPLSPRITTCQKCVRADDIEKVGHTARHHTFFEMLGNFSFGDYFKYEAILWAWELLTEIYKLPREKLLISIHTEDEEAFRIWNEEVGIPQEKIFPLADNFWGPIGLSGPCGPCSEIFMDLGEDRGCGKQNCAPGCDCDRFFEFWNLVFTTYNKTEDNQYQILPKKNIDTGLGQERLTMILQNKPSPYQTDLFSPIMERIANLTPVALDHPRYQLASRIIADHSRAIVFMIADGVTPSNEGRGYVLRRILRRAVVYGQFIEIQPPFLSQLTPSIVEAMAEIYPELKERQLLIQHIMEQEEMAFKKTLEEGLQKIEEEKSKFLSGEFIFKLHDTYGFPLELTREIAHNKDISIDEKGFRMEMEKQKSRSRADLERKTGIESRREMKIEGIAPTEFVGYKELEVECKVLDFKQVSSGEEIILILDRSPFYAESGGQVGDKGWIYGDNFTIEIYDTQKDIKEVYLHYGKIIEGMVSIEKLQQKPVVTAKVDAKRRKEIACHHTATHLLHASLRNILGPHIVQSGSLVERDRLRFDFSHFSPLTPEEKDMIEDLANSKIQENIPLKISFTSLKAAQEKGAIALFDEKYGQEVRLVEINEFSKELCGGTHVENTGEIGFFKIIEESAIGSGLRRIEAKAGSAALEFLLKADKLIDQLSKSLKVTREGLPIAINKLKERIKQLEHQAEKLSTELARSYSEILSGKAIELEGINIIVEKVKVTQRNTLRCIIDSIKGKFNECIVVLGATDAGKATLICGVSLKLTKKGFHAGEIIKEIAIEVGGSGGGKPELAEAGGKDASRLDIALNKAKDLIRNKLQPKPTF